MNMIIKVVGSGCTNCQTLQKRTEEAMNDLNIEGMIEKVTDFKQIASYGVMRTTGLVIDDKVVISGSVPTVEIIKEVLLTHRNAQ